MFLVPWGQTEQLLYRLTDGLFERRSPACQSTSFISLDRFRAEICKICLDALDSRISLLVCDMEAKVVADCETTIAGGRAVAHQTRTNNKHSGVCDPISLVRGDHGDLIHYRTEFSTPGLKVLGASGGLSGRSPTM